jgi:branched-chain amino acid transport system substrate-binding protein
MTKRYRLFVITLLIALIAVLIVPGTGSIKAQGRTIKIGYVSPQTGPLAAFGEADEFILKGVREAIGKGITVNGTVYPVEILVQDSQSDPNRAAKVASDLILKDKVDLIVVASTPETTNPVSDQCETLETPCISTVAPWQPWYFRNPDAVKAGGYKWTYHFFWGLEDIIKVFTDLWDSQKTNKIVGALWPNDGDGLAWGDAELGFPPALKKAGYTVVDPGRYENGKSDFSAEIALFKKENVEIVTGVMIPPDLGTFLTQASQQGFNPKMFTVGKAALFPSVVQSISNNLGENLTTEIWWTPSHPFKSSLTGQKASELAAAYTEATKRQWTQPVGFAHALFEVALDALKRTKNIDDKAAIVTAIQETKLDTMVGPIAWGKEPNTNVAKTPLVGGQWQKGEKFPLDLVITSNTGVTTIPTAGKTAEKVWTSK